MAAVLLLDCSSFIRRTVCVCVIEREREKGREGGKEGEREGERERGREREREKELIKVGSHQQWRESTKESSV